ncbi:MAG: hypothetical protein ABIP75_07445, partial [Pyrinomonadaceae bacterium]
MKRFSLSGLAIATAFAICFGVIVFASVSAQEPGKNAVATTTTTITAPEGKGCCGADACAKGGCCSGDSCGAKAKPATAGTTGAHAAMPGMAMGKTEGAAAGCCACCGSESCAMAKPATAGHGDGHAAGGCASMSMPASTTPAKAGGCASMAMGTTAAKAGDDPKKAGGCCACCGSESCAMAKPATAGAAGTTATTGKTEGMACCAGAGGCCAKPAEK